MAEIEGKVLSVTIKKGNRQGKILLTGTTEELNINKDDDIAFLGMVNVLTAGCISQHTVKLTIDNENEIDSVRITRYLD